MLRLLALVPVVHLVNALFIAMARVRRNLRQVIAIQMAQCVSSLVLSYVLLGMYGITGIGFALLLTEGVIATFLLITQGRWLLDPFGSICVHVSVGAFVNPLSVRQRSLR